MHVRDMIHRDLKPANIFYELKKNGIHILKIGDFGCARLDLKDAID
jgi:serine/threonine protein kinase